MAVNAKRWLRDDAGSEKPLRILLPVAAGSTDTIKRGEICTDNSGVWHPGVSGDTTTVVIADQEQKSDDVARHLWFIVPRPLDVFEFALSAARAVGYGDPLAISDSETLAYTAAGTNAIARACDNSNRPLPADESTTNRSVSYVQCHIDEQASYITQLTGNS